MTRTSGAAIEHLDHLDRIEGGIRGESLPVKPRPLVSIIVVAFRDRDEVAALIDNIAAFRGDNLELVIVDGGSDDGTVELLQTSTEKIDYWVSEPDGGIYEAMNKGLAAASGEYILHLNAGDRLKCVPCETLAKCLTEGVDVASFPVLMDQDEVFYPKTGFLLRIDNTWHHQGTFYRRASHIGYNTQYRVFGDLDLNQRMLKNGRSVRLFEQVVSYHLNNGISMSRVDFHEVYRSIRDNFGRSYVAIAFLWFKYKGALRRSKRLSTYLASRLRKSQS
jgi:glycosyltransferase involved in cell wall biosynthesis